MICNYCGAEIEEKQCKYCGAVNKVKKDKLNEIKKELKKNELRNAFIETFGKEQTIILENAAKQHYLEGGTISGENKGSDPFKWTLFTVIDQQCIAVKEYRKYHGITISYRKFLKWCRKYSKELGEHDGDIGWLALFAGAYNWIVYEKEYKKMRKRPMGKRKRLRKSKKDMKAMRMWNETMKKELQKRKEEGKIT